MSSRVGNVWAPNLFPDGLFADQLWADSLFAQPIPRPAGIRARPTQPYAIVEIDIPFCELEYGVAPCQAVLGGTVTVNVTAVSEILVPFTGYVFEITTNVAHNLIEGGYVNISGVNATGDYVDINGEHAVNRIITTTKFRILTGTGFVNPTGGYTSGGTFTSSILGATGMKKCFNTIRTCQDRANFTPADKTLRFCEPNEETLFTSDSRPVVVIPSLLGIDVTPSTIRPGIDIGLRESVRVTFRDHQHSDAGLDKYLEDRDYNPFTRGTFWAKLRARNRTLEGYPIRIIRGDAGTDLTEADVYHYVIDSITGQTDNVTIAAKDFLTLTDQKKAQCPRISNGALSADLAIDAMTFTVVPVGIGDAEYPTSGKVSLGGKEIVPFTREGDVFTLTNRGISGTEAEEHDEGDIVQLVKIFGAQGPADIIYKLLTQFTPGVKASWIDKAEWEVEVDEYIGRLYEAEIAEPTPVATLLNELIEQVGLVFWADPRTVSLQLRSLRPVSAGARLLTDEHFLAGLRAQEQTQSRISEVWTYYGQRNPLEGLNETNNYKAAIVSVDANALTDYPHPAIKKVFSRWITIENRAAASRLNATLLARYRDPPRKFHLTLFKTLPEVPELGAGIRIQSWMLQDDTGAETPVPIQITSRETQIDKYVIDAQESIFVEQDDLEETKLLFIDDVVYGINMRTLFDTIYLPPKSGDVVRAIVGNKAALGSKKNTIPAFEVGSWPEGVTLELVINPGGEIEGKGGDGDTHGADAAKKNGGTAIKTRYPITVTNGGRIRGGGGGGGRGNAINIGVDPDIILKSAGGGGGAGRAPGIGGAIGGQNATSAAGGAGGRYTAEGSTSVGGDGGAPGEAGLSGNGPAGGAAGAAVDGESFVTYIEVGTIDGARIN
jgi:hypothetical protein